MVILTKEADVFKLTRQRPAVSINEQSTWNGRPLNPEKSGWHWIEDSEGPRPMLWRGNDWPEPLDRCEWQDGYAMIRADDLSRDRYYGPVLMSVEVTIRFDEKLLVGAL